MFGAFIHRHDLIMHDGIANLAKVVNLHKALKQ